MEEHRLNKLGFISSNLGAKLEHSIAAPPWFCYYLDDTKGLCN